MSNNASGDNNYIPSDLISLIDGNKIYDFRKWRKSLWFCKNIFNILNEFNKDKNSFMVIIKILIEKEK